MRRFGLVLFGVLGAMSCGGDGGNGPPTITAVVISGDSTVVLNGTRQLTATAMSGASVVTGSGVTFQWTSNNGPVAIVSGTGLVSGGQRGTATISAMAVLDGTPTGVSGTHAIRVRIGSIFVAPGAPQFSSLGDTVALIAEGRDANNSAVGGITFAWQSRTASVATATSAGATQANVVAVANGTSRIVVTGDGVSDSVTATVQQVATTLSVTPDTVTFGRIDTTLAPTVTATDARGNSVGASAIGWTAQDTGVARVSAATGAITSVNEGQTRVIGASGALRDTVRVGVVLVYSSVEITNAVAVPIDSALITRLSGTLQIGARVRDAGSTVVPNPAISFSLKSGTIASIGASTGLITGNTNTGRDTVVVVARTVRDSVPLIVRQDVASVVLTPVSPADLNFVGDTQRFAAEARDGGGAAIPGTSFGWSTTNAVLGVDAAGLATAVGRTSATGVVVSVIAAAAGRADTSPIRVKQVPDVANLNPNSFSTLTAFGQQVNASCVVLDSAADTIPSHACTWAANTPGIVTFTPTQAVTTSIKAVGNGSTTITAQAAPSLFGFNSVTVAQAAARVKLHPQTADTSRIVTTTGTMRMIDSVFDSNDSLIRSPAPSITWSSTAASASVDATGLVSASGSAGSTFIKAVSGTGRDSALVVVTSTPTTLSGAVQPIFNVSCTGCHFAGGAAGMDLSPGAARGQIVNVTAGESALPRAYPQRPDSSYLVHKVQGTHLVPPANGSGVRMPFGCSGASCLTKGQINAIRNWILQGGLNN